MGNMVYLIAWFIPILLFWIVLKDIPMLFFIILYTWYPVLGGIISYKLVMNDQLRKWRYLSPIGLGYINCGVFYVTYGITNVLSMSNVAWDDFGNFILNTLSSIIGLIIGIVVYNIRIKKS